MVFSSPIFLTVFLPAVLLAMIIAPRRIRNIVLLVASLAFYYWGAAGDTWVLLWVVAVSFFGARHLDRPVGLWVTLVGVLAPLGWFKYSAFFSEIGLDVLSVAGVGGSALQQPVLPIGISFFTFQALSYVIDVRRGDAEPLDRIDRHLLYIAMFPQLIAGPIVRFAEIRDQLFVRTVSVDALAVGATRFVHGLSKKVIIADSVAPIADAAFASGEVRPTVAAWIGILAYAVQIYFDFSGYSDMAIGLGTMFGFTFPENFERPYSAMSITEFWRRWHITLSSWFRDYVYIPLGGSRRGDLKTYRNLAFVFALTALWHGAAWTFLIWGGLHGVWLIVERVTGLASMTGHRLARRVLTLFIVLVAWVFFRASTVEGAVDYVVDLLTLSRGPMSGELVAAMTLPAVLALLIGVSSFAFPTRWLVGQRLSTITAEGIAATDVRSQALRLGYLSAALPLCMVLIASNDFSPFLYFQF